MCRRYPLAMVWRRVRHHCTGFRSFRGAADPRRTRPSTVETSLSADHGAWFPLASALLIGAEGAQAGNRLPAVKEACEVR
jgi:hypothetical protein